MRAWEEVCSVGEIGDGTRRTTLDGTQVAFAGELDFSRPATTLAEVLLADGKDLQQFASGDLMFGEWSAREVGVTQWEEEYSYQHGILRIGGAVIVDQFTGSRRLAQMGTWEGQNFSLKTQVIGGKPADVLRYFEALEVLEEDLGIRVTPRAGAGFSRDDPHVPRILKVIPGLGTVIARQLTESLKQNKPSWDGLRVAGGELYRIGSGERISLTLLGESAQVTIVPHAWMDEAEAIEMASRLQVSWGLP